MATGNINNNITLSPQLGTSLLHGIKSAFRNFGKDESLYKSELISAFRSLNLEMSLSELDQLLAGACIAGKRREADYLTRGEFAISVVELIRYKRVKQPMTKSNPLAALHYESDNSSKEPHYQVFLGGSCNPTTWRIETAIPYLEREGVSYYNPQVDDWYPELIEIEEKAKRSSTIKFFVFDSETRGIASLVETAFMASIGWRLVVVLHYLPESTEVKIAGETLSKHEVKDLNRGRSFLCDILEKLGVPVFDNLEEALECTCDVIQGRISYARLLTEKKGTMHQYGNWLLQIRNLFDRFSSTPEFNRSVSELPQVDDISVIGPKRGSVPDILDVDVRRAKLCLKKLTPSLTPDSAIAALQLFLQTRSLHAIHDKLNLFDLYGMPIDYEVFCLFTAEAVYQHSNSIWNWGSSIMSNFFQYAYSLLNTALQPSIDINNNETIYQEGQSLNLPEYDLFLGGTCASTVWRTKLAIPLLEANSITYYNPQLPPEEWNIRKIADENLAKQTSKSFLLVISTDSPSIASMTEAAYLTTSSKSVFLTIADISPTSGDFAYPLTVTACKDYNRGRAYLKKTAELFKIPVFDTIEETLDSIVKYYSTRSV